MPMQKILESNDNLRLSPIAIPLIEVFFWPFPLLGPDHYIQKAKHSLWLYSYYYRRVKHKFASGLVYLPVRASKGYFVHEYSISFYIPSELHLGMVNSDETGLNFNTCGNIIVLLFAFGNIMG